MRSTYEPVHHFVGLNNLDEYDFDFKITALAQLRIVEINAAGTVTQDIDGTDTTYLSSVTFDAVNGGGTVYLAANLPENWNLYLVLNIDAPVQLSQFRNKSSFNLKDIEMAFDNVSGGVQTASYLAQRSIKLPVEIALADFNMDLPTDLADADNENRVLMTNTTHNGWELGPTASAIEDAAADAAAAAASALAAAASATAADSSETDAEAAATAAAASAAAAAAIAGVLTTTIAVGDNVTTTFNTGVALAAVNFVMVFIDTLYQDNTTYTKVGTNIVFGVAPLTGSNIVMLVGTVQPDVATALAAAQAAQTAAELAETNAEAAQVAAEAAQTAAELAETNAETAETNAETAETNAELAETNAETAETNAETAQAAAEAARDAALAAVSAATGLAEYATDAAFVVANGAAEDGDIYYNTTSDRIRYYDGGWRDVGSQAPSYADDAAYVTANGVAEEGSYYLNTTLDELRVYANGAWGGVGGGALLATGTRAAPSAIVAGTGIAFTGTAARQMWFIEGSGGAVDVSANPQIAAATTVGQELVLIGRNDTNTVLLEDGTGLDLNGPYDMGASSVLSLVWDGSAWVEMSRR